MHDPWTSTKGSGHCWMEGGYPAEGRKGGKIETTVIA